MRSTPLTESYLPVLARYGLSELALPQLSLLHFSRGEYLYRVGKRMEWLLLMVRGRAKVCRASENGKSLLLTFYSGEGLLGDIELVLDMAEATSDVQAITPITAVGVPYALKDALLSNPAFVLAITRVMARRIDHNTQNSVATVLNPLEARLCSYIRLTAANGVFREKLTVLAELMGVSYRHLLRALKALCERGVLQKETSAYRVVDAEALDRLGGDVYRF